MSRDEGGREGGRVGKDVERGGREGDQQMRRDKGAREGEQKTDGCGDTLVIAWYGPCGPVSCPLILPLALQSQVLYDRGRRKAKRKQPTVSTERVGQEMLGRLVRQPITYYTKSEALRWLDPIPFRHQGSP